MRVPPSFDVLNPLDVTELGERAAMGLHGENRGLPLRQRLQVITGRKPPRMAWRMHFTDGVCSSMSWPAFVDEGCW